MKAFRMAIEGHCKDMIKGSEQAPFFCQTGRFLRVGLQLGLQSGVTF